MQSEEGNTQTTTKFYHLWRIAGSSEKFSCEYNKRKGNVVKTPNGSCARVEPSVQENHFHLGQIKLAEFINYIYSTVRSLQLLQNVIYLQETKGNVDFLSIHYENQSDR